MGNRCARTNAPGAQADNGNHGEGQEGDSLLGKSSPLPGPGGKRLGMWGLVFMTYFAVCGGPYGLEPAVKAGYPFFFILGMLIIPWLWSLPSALMTAELSTALPESGGFVVWVKTAFGPFFAFQEAWWSFVNNLFDLSIYPVMCENYIASLVPLQPYQAYLIRFGVLVLCAVMNLFGVDVVSKISGFFLLLVLTPFALIIGFGASHIHPADWWQIPPVPFSEIKWGLFLTTIVWSTGGFDNMSQVAQDLKNPTKSYPRAMVITLFAMIFTTILPFLFAFSIAPNYALWKDGYWSEIALLAAGDWLRIVLVVGSIISAASILNAYLCTCSEMLAAWGEPDLLGIKVLGLQSRWKTPWVAILANSCLIAIGTLMPFEFLVQMDQLFYSLGLILEYLSLIKLRFSHPDLHRPYKIPLNKYLLILFVMLPLGFCCLTIVMPLISNWKIALITGCCIIFGGVAYPVLTFIRRRCGSVESGKAAIN